MAPIGASLPLPSVSTKVRLLNRLPTLDLWGGDYSSCPLCSRTLRPAAAAAPPSSPVIPDKSQPWRSKRDGSCSEMLFEEKIGVRIVVKAVDLAPSGTAVKLDSLWQGAVRIELKSLDG